MISERSWLSLRISLAVSRDEASKREFMESNSADAWITVRREMVC